MGWGCSGPEHRSPWRRHCRCLAHPHQVQALKGNLEVLGERSSGSLLVTGPVMTTSWGGWGLEEIPQAKAQGQA